jgi:hypothetical protein
MTTPAPRPNATAADLVRLLAAWLATILLVQGLAAGLKLGAGPLHRHASATVLAHDHRHHDETQRHHHRADDGSDVAQDEPALDASALALVVALALMAFSILRFAFAARCCVWAAAMQPPWRSAVPAPPRKPPRSR